MAGHGAGFEKIGAACADESKSLVTFVAEVFISSVQAAHFFVECLKFAYAADTCAHSRCTSGLCLGHANGVKGCSNVCAGNRRKQKPRLNSLLTLVAKRGRGGALCFSKLRLSLEDAWP